MLAGVSSGFLIAIGISRALQEILRWILDEAKPFLLALSERLIGRVLEMIQWVSDGLWSSTPQSTGIV